jgi:hypothetical protein
VKNKTSKQKKTKTKQKLWHVFGVVWFCFVNNKTTNNITPFRPITCNQKLMFRKLLILNFQIYKWNQILQATPKKIPCKDIYRWKTKQANKRKRKQNKNCDTFLVLCDLVLSTIKQHIYAKPAKWSVRLFLDNIQKCVTIFVLFLFSFVCLFCFSSVNILR